MKLVRGVGINDADYEVVVFEEKALAKADGRTSRKRLWICPFYRTWTNMLTRAYHEGYSNQNPTYEDVSVCKEWHRFSTFKAWMQEQDWEDKCLDKDILVPGNKLYSPETCVFVTERANLFLTDTRRRRREETQGFPAGVALHKQSGSVVGHIWVDASKRVSKVFDTAAEAHLAWAESKLAIVPMFAEREDLPENITAALLARYQMTVDNARVNISPA